jgi:hypothetical protein
VLWVLLAPPFILTWAGSALIIDTPVRHRKKPSLAERLQSFRLAISDEVELWLRRQR